jgi:hypothetical protein
MIVGTTVRTFWKLIKEIEYQYSRAESDNTV